ncbi:MAG TPA: spore germination protein [Ruminiclostridium sp.]|nr:spore germination protein [Ruminiclostridium sp.]
MRKILSSIGQLFIYKEPKNNELGVELLELPDEGGDKPGKQEPQAANNKSDGNNKKDSGNKTNKTPLKVEEWNEKKKKGDSSEQPQNGKQSTDTAKSDNGEQTQKHSGSQSGNSAGEESNGKISSVLADNLKVIEQRLGVPKNVDIIIRQFNISKKIKAFIVYVDGMIDKQTLNLSILPSLMSSEIAEELANGNPIDYLIENILTVHSIKKQNMYQQIIEQVLNGDTALFLEGSSECITMETKGYDKRSIEAPKTETVVKGAQEGFTENLRTNLTMVRRIIKNGNLVTEMLPVGDTNKANCAVVYIEGIANQSVVEEVKKRINNIKTDFIMGDGMLEQFIEDSPFMLFPQVITTERPDRTASFIMEGQVVIITEGSPFSMAVPVTFFRLLHTSEDTFLRWPFGTFLRLVRLLGLFCATLLPGLYVSMVMFHPEMIPTELLSSIAKAKEPVPFPTIIEVFFMEAAFELIREGGIRVPSVIGQTLGIVGALILGQAAVSAGLVSPILVIIVSVTALGSFAIPNYDMSLAIRIERFFFIFAGALLGFYGVSLVIFILGCFACGMKSFGVPFFSPVAPRTKVNPDLVIRTPIWMQKNRPDGFQTVNRKKQASNMNSWGFTEKKDDKGGNNP